MREHQHTVASSAFCLRSALSVLWCVPCSVRTVWPWGLALTMHMCAFVHWLQLMQLVTTTCHVLGDQVGNELDGGHTRLAPQEFLQPPMAHLAA